MKYPMINKQPRREVRVPELSGGLNLRDSLTGVRDNQMTDCVNMWYKDGTLKTRPPFVTSGNMCATMGVEFDDVFITNLQSHEMVKNEEAILVSGIKYDGNYETGEWFERIIFFWQYTDKTIYAGHIDLRAIYDQACENEKALQAAADKYSRLAFAKDGYLYLFLTEKDKRFSAFKSAIDDKLSWDYIDWHEYYIPTVYAHCMPTNNGWSFSGTQFEAYNSLCDSYKMVYSLYNPACEKHPMIYGLGDVNLKDGYIIEATIINKDGEEEKYTVEKSIFYTTAQSKKENDKIMTVVFENDYQYITFSRDNDYQNSVIELSESDNYAEDNLIITVSPSHPFTDKSRARIFNMTQSIWFGGAANGINGGSRLFLCGNTDENEKSLVVWSGLNNPLYFPENNYAYVGDKSQGVTAFGQQGENLVIFKEKSTYYSYYATNDNITAEHLISQSVIDYEAGSVYFPIVQLNASIGCDCPGTVQLCRNRLVWANSDGCVYTLYSNNQYSERTIYKISDMVNSMLKKENDLKNAISCDFEGHYLLCVGNNIYVMDYNSYGFQYASSYTKNEDSNALIPWYVWMFDKSKYGGKIFALGNKLMIFRDFKLSGEITCAFSVLSNDKDDGCDSVLIYDEINGELKTVDEKINSMMQTKLFDFSAGGYLKNIDRVSIGLGNNDGAAIKIDFISDVGCDSEYVSLNDSAKNKRDAAFIRFKNFYPAIRSVRTFGVKIECDGQLIIDGLSLQYRTLGGVK